MSIRTDNETKSCSFMWKIVNISHCWLNLNESLDSPVFVADELEGTRWFLRLYPNQNEEVIIYLHRTLDCNGPPVMKVNFRLDLMDKEGKILISSALVNLSFTKSDSSYTKRFVRENIFVTEREKFLPEDTLTVCCKIWKNEETLLKSRLVSARTFFQVNRRSFVWKIEEFSKLKPGVKNKFKDDLMDFELVLKEGQCFACEKPLALNFIAVSRSVKYLLFKTSIINSEGEKEECETHECFKNDLQKETFSTVLFAKLVLDNKSRYLLNDALTLDCEIVYSTGTVLDKYCVSGIISAEAQNGVIEKRNPTKKEEPQSTLVLANDFKSMYNNKDFSDVELRTSTKTFPAHKLILIARSPVFRRMFSNDMRENSSGHVDIEDLEDDTVHRMLLYMYTDSFEDLQFENACKLYVAADKYEILSLRSRCSSCLKRNLCPTKACDILVLADRHQDEDLKNAAQDFILTHKEVFGSEEWKQLMATNIQVAADVMYRKVFPA